MSENQTTRVQLYLDRWRNGDSAARDDLLRLARERLQQLVRQMRKMYQIAERWADTDDVMQNAQMRLWRALESATPESPRHFYNLAALQIRRELIDLVRHFHREAAPRVREVSLPEGSTSTSLANEPAAESSLDPAQQALWTEFHERAAGLPEPEREVVYLVWYCGLSKPEAAGVMGISVRTLYRHWNEAWSQLTVILK